MGGIFENFAVVNQMKRSFGSGIMTMMCCLLPEGEPDKFYLISD
jgi:hypothetical protein